VSIGLAFYIILLVWAVFGILSHFGYVGGVYAVGVNAVVLFVLFLLLGWKVFGPPLHG